MDKITLSVLKHISILDSLYRFLIQEQTAMDDVKSEKEVAMRRFNHRRRFKRLAKATAVFVLFLLAQSSAYWLPIAADLLRETVAVFRSHLFVFALFNCIILAVYALSARIPRPPSNDAAPEKADIYNEFVTSSRRISASPPTETVLADEPKRSDIITDKALVVSETIHSHSHDPPPPPKYQLQRTCSASFQMKTTIGEESQRDFRRSYTDIRRKLTSGGGREESSAVVNTMSNEEFNRKIEDFIANQKWIQQEEYKEERKTERFIPLLLTTPPCASVNHEIKNAIINVINES